MNSVNLIGRFTKAPELRYTQNDKAVVSAFIAINNGKDENGNERQPNFPKIRIYNKQAENVAKYCSKGSLVGISGSIKTSSWDKEDGTKAYDTYVLAERVQFLSTKDKNEDSNSDITTDFNNDSSGFDVNDPDVITLDDDDLPF